MYEANTTRLPNFNIYRSTYLYIKYIYLGTFLLLLNSLMHIKLKYRYLPDLSTIISMYLATFLGRLLLNPLFDVVSYNLNYEVKKLRLTSV